MDKRKFRHSLTTIPFDEKLERKRFGRIKSAITTTESTIEEFGEKIQRKNAHVWSGGTFKNNEPSNGNWLGSYMIGMDFDTGTQTPEDIYKIFAEFGIVPNLYYYTFSDSPALRKFRIVLYFDEEITERKIYDAIMRALDNICEIDTSCKDPARVFYGGDGVTITNPYPIPFQQFMHFIDINKISKDGNLTRSMINIDSNYANFPSSLYYNNKEYHYLAQNENTSSSPLPTSLQGGTRIDLELARQTIKIWDKFLSGEWLHHKQLLPLATNLRYIQGGLKKMEKTMKYYNDLGRTGYTNNNFAIFPYVRKKKYFPVPIHKFSPYPEDADHHDFVSELTNKRGHITIIEEKNKIPSQEASKQFEEKFNEVINSTDYNKAHLILVPTAMGKTEFITKVQKSVCAFPTNGLKNEVIQRMSKKVDFTFSPDTIQYNDSSLQKKLDNYYEVGLTQKSMSLIRSIAEYKIPTSLPDMDLSLQYLSQLETCSDVNKSVLTTHKRLLNSDQFNHSTVIFDEDPLHTLVEIQNTTKSHISSLYHFYEPIQEVINYLKKLEDNIYERPNFNFDQDELIKKCDNISGIDTNVFDFFNCKYFIINGDHIEYIIKKDLPSEKKNIIMSATLSPYIYQKLYPEVNFEIFNIRNVEQKGKVIQYTGRSCSRSGLDRYGEQVSKEIGATPVITFKGYDDQFQNADQEVYFGNCSGYDHLKGLDLVVVGTPHRSMIQYFLLAKLMNVDFDLKNSPVNYQKVRYNGFEFMFNCFDNEELRMIQLTLIESDLIQAVGRARTLREDCTVELYSGLPLDITTEFHIKKPI